MFLTVEAHREDEKTARSLFRDVKEDFGKLQRRAGLPRHNVEVLEGQHAVHSHIVGPLPWSYAVRLRDYAYGEQLVVKRVDYKNGLRNYLLKEATPQAAYRQSFTRRKGAHRLGEGGGDRVRLSRELAAVLEEKGVLQPHKRTYASRAISKAKNAPAAFSASAIAIPAPAPKLTIVVSNEIVPEPVQLPLPMDIPEIPILEPLDVKRREEGLTEAQLSEGQLGVRQAHYSNAAKRRHDNFSGTVLRRALAWLRAA